MVARSIKDDPVALREPRYSRADEKLPDEKPKPHRIALIVNDQHSIHHVNDRGYVEAPVRIPVITDELAKTKVFETVKARRYGVSVIERVHKPEFVRFLRNACANVPAGKSVYPYVFPVRNRARPPREVPLRAGYYCIDGSPAVYALVRPPGHHAESMAFGGFCYFNSAAIAANHLSDHGRVVLLDIDYHHGNGSQDIFYKRKDVFTISLHGHPRYSYPYFSGFEDEKGEDEGKGFNLNLPLAENLNGEQYRKVLAGALEKIRKYDPQFLVLSLGLDTAKGDPTGSFSLIAKDFRDNGRMIGELQLPTLVVQEGGYKTQTLGINARHFFSGLWSGLALRSASAKKH